MGMRELTIGGTSQGELGATADIGSLDLANIGEDIPDRPDIKDNNQMLGAMSAQIGAGASASGKYFRPASDYRQELRRDSSGKLYWAKVLKESPALPADFSELK